MITRRVDVAVIGAGSAGLRAYRAAKKETANVVLIEGGPYGTTCARVGCMPSKLLIAAAEAAHGAAEAHRFGIDVEGIEVNGRAVMDRVRRERDRFVGFVVEGTEKIPGEDRIRGYAQFVDDHELIVDDHTSIIADRVVIATGSRPAYPSRWNELGDRLIVNDDIFDWEDLPSSVAVFGPGVIGLELGQALARLGVQVRLFGLGGKVGPLSDERVMAAAREAMQSEFLLDPNANVSRLERTEEGVAIDYEDQDGVVQTALVDFVIAATGRTPNVDKLKLENTSLPLDERGVPVFDENTMQIGRSHVFIAGDVDNDRPLLHEAADEGDIAGRNAGRFPAVEPGARRSPLAVVFSDPQIAMVGARLADLDERDVAVGEVSFEDQGRARVMLKNQGLLRVYADCRTGRFLGAEMVGPGAEHIGHLLAWAHQAGLTITEMLEMPFYHPVIEEGLRTALREAQKGVGHCLRVAA
ncbi:MAG: dihydrolipoyl dehydrogenase [Pseudomonadota bacterium]